MSTFDISTRRSRKHVIYVVAGLVLLGLHTNAVYMFTKYPEAPPSNMPVQALLAVVMLLAWIVAGAVLVFTLGWTLPSLTYKVIKRWIDGGKPDPEPIPGFTYVPASSPYDDTGC